MKAWEWEESAGTSRCFELEAKIEKWKRSKRGQLGWYQDRNKMQLNMNPTASHLKIFLKYYSK